MRNVLVSTSNVERIMGATRALEERLADPEIAGLGLVSGDPGLGKTLTAKHYASHAAKAGDRAIYIRALAIWRPASMLRGLLRELGREPERYQADVMFDALVEHLQRYPTFILIDEVDSVAGSSTLVRILKDLHDMTSCAFLLIGEARVQRVLTRYTSFFNRVNTGAIVEASPFSDEDIAAVIRERSEIPIAQEVCDLIAEGFSGSMRSVVDAIRGIELWARANDRQAFNRADYQSMLADRSGRLRVAQPQEAIG